MNRLNTLFQTQKDILSVFFTAGYPHTDGVAAQIKRLADAGVDMIEVGLPFSDPLADGPVIQESSKIALNNGITLNRILQQLESIREHTEVPLVAMGYLNPVLKFGMEKFLDRLNEVQVDALILPDLPPDIFEKNYRLLYEKFKIAPVFLITPQTTDARVRYIDSISNAFIYQVSTASTTGARIGFSDQDLAYFKRINDMGLKTPRMIGFGIKDLATFQTACKYSSGAIIGSEFIRSQNRSEKEEDFVSGFRKEVIN